jgi:hypothetical protein
MFLQARDLGNGVTITFLDDAVEDGGDDADADAGGGGGAEVPLDTSLSLVEWLDALAPGHGDEIAAGCAVRKNCNRFLEMMYNDEDTAIVFENGSRSVLCQDRLGKNKNCRRTNMRSRAETRAEIRGCFACLPACLPACLLAGSGAHDLAGEKTALFARF